MSDVLSNFFYIPSEKLAKKAKDDKERKGILTVDLLIYFKFIEILSRQYDFILAASWEWLE
jgi:hypothetical protein